MQRKDRKNNNIWRARKATALPVTYLMLFVSLTLAITATYYVAMTKLSAKGQSVNFSAAKQAMIGLESCIEKTMWSPGSSRVCYFDDYGGGFQVLPNARLLLINISNSVFSDTIFASFAGEALYKLAYAEAGSSGLFLIGDTRSVVKGTSDTMSQLEIRAGETSQEIVIGFRPFVSMVTTGTSGVKPINTLRLYIVSLSFSQEASFLGSSYVKANCASVDSSIERYDLAQVIDSVHVEVVLGSKSGSVSFSISSSESGSIIELELLVCNINLQKVGV